MAISTYKVFLMKGTTADGSTTYAKLVDIKDFPDLGAAPESLQTTTLSDKQHTYIPGIDNVEGLEFTANYTSADYTTLKALEGTETKFAVYFGGTEADGVVTPTGSDGQFTFNGYLAVHPVGGGVNEVVGMSITIIPSSVITFTVPGGAG